MHKNQREPCESTQHSRSLDLWRSLIEVIHTALCYTAENPESHGLSQYVKCLQTSQPNSPKWQSKNRSGQNTTCNYLLLEDRSPSNKTLGIDIRTKTPTSVNGVVQISHPQIRTSKKNGTEPMKLQHRETSTSPTAVDSDTTTSNGPPFPPPPPVLIIEPPPFFCPSKKPCQLNNSNSCSALSEVRSEISRPTSFRLKPLRWLKLKTVCSNSVWSLKSRTPSDCMVTQSDRLPLTNSSLVDFQQLIRLFPVTSKDHSENKSGNAPSMTTTDQRRFEQISISRNRMNESIACDLTNGVDNYQDTAAAQTEDISALPNAFIRGRALSQSRNSDMTAKKPRLLDNKRCLNVNIYLRQFKSVSFSLIDAIDNRWSTLIGAERLRALVKLLPSEPEVGTFRSFSGDVETLDPAEKFLIELVTVSNYKQKIDHMLLREEFHSCSHWFGPALDKLLETVKALITSETLCGLLHLVLDLGNFLNEGKSFGAATAFKIESLLKLSDVRSINPKFTLLHFLVQHVQQHYPQYMSVRQEFPHIKESCGICTEAISKEIQKLQYRLKVMINQVGQEDDPPEDLLTFIETAKNEMDQLEARMVRLTELTNQCADYFSEERSSFRLTSCLQTFSTFFTKMDCAEQELRQMDLQQKKARQTEEGLFTKISPTSSAPRRRTSLIEHNFSRRQDRLLKHLVAQNGDQVSFERILPNSMAKSVDTVNGDLVNDGNSADLDDTQPVKTLIQENAADTVSRGNLTTSSILNYLSPKPIQRRSRSQRRDTTETHRHQVRAIFDLSSQRERLVPVLMTSSTTPLPSDSTKISSDECSSDEETARRITDRLKHVSKQIDGKKTTRKPIS